MNIVSRGLRSTLVSIALLEVVFGGELYVLKDVLWEWRLMLRCRFDFISMVLVLVKWVDGNFEVATNVFCLERIPWSVRKEIFFCCKEFGSQTTRVLA